MTTYLIIVLSSILVFSHELEDGIVSKRDTTMTFMTFVNCDLFNAYVCRSADKCFYEIPIFGVSYNVYVAYGGKGSIFSFLSL